MKPILSSAEQEISLLKQVIGNLLEQIEQIKDDNQFLLEQIIENNPLRSNQGEQDTTNNAIRSREEAQSRINYLIYSYHQRQSGTNEKIYSNTRQDIGTNEKIYSNTRQDIGTNDVIYSDDGSRVEANDFIRSQEPQGQRTNENNGLETGQAIITEQMVQSATEQGMMTGDAISPNPKLPDTIEPNGMNVGRLTSAVGSSFSSKAKRSTPRNTACMLLWLHNNRHAKRQELQKAAGMSESGFAKRFSAVCKLGWITRQAHMKYVLTPAGIALLHKTFAK